MVTRALPARPRAKADPAGGSPGPARKQFTCREGQQLPGRAGRATEARLALLRAEYARLVTAARASVAAARAGATDPLVYVEAELVRHCGLPPQDATVPAVLADANAATELAGRAAGPDEPVKAAADRPPRVLP